ncbi:hypothetical protein GGI10_002951 [Coemansia sp. RSA 2530]|nr:hypothetical protein GGI10_002951 [Coemansia sp. RSA 2530]
MPEFFVAEHIKPLVRYAHFEKGYQSVVFDINKIEFQLGKALKASGIGILFYHKGECRAVHDTFDDELFKAELERLPNLDELSVARAKEKAKAKAKEKEAKAKLIDQTDTLAKCEEFQAQNKNGVYFFFSPKPLTMTLFSQIIRPMVGEALNREFNCAWFKSDEVGFHTKIVPGCQPSGILIFHDGKCKAHLEVFDINEFVALLDQLPGMKELNVEPPKPPSEPKKEPVKPRTIEDDYPAVTLKSCCFM